MQSPLTRAFRYLCLLLPVLGCSACASLSGAWYYQTGDADDGDNLFLAVVNDSSEEQRIRHLKINTSDTGASLGWTCETSRDTGFPLVPGQLLVVTLPTGGDFQCAVPTHGEAIRADGRRLDFQLPRSVPSALPEGWRKACALNVVPARPKPVDPVDTTAFQCQTCQATAATTNSTAPTGSSAKFVCESCTAQADKEKQKSEPPPTPALVCTPCRGTDSEPCESTAVAAAADASRD